MEDGLTVIGLFIENLRGVKAVTLYPRQTGVVTINGKNAAGKSSVLDAICMALGSADVQPAEPIRHGEESAAVVADLGPYVVKRTWTTKGSYLKVERRQDGETLQVAKPREFLDRLIGSGIGFDPLEFAGLKPTEQVTQVLDLVHLPRDPRVIDTEIRGLYDARTTVNRRVKELEGAIAQSPQHPDVPVEELVLGDLMAAMQAAMIEKTKNEGSRRILEDRTRDVARLTSQIERLRKELQDAEKSLENAVAARDLYAAMVADLVDPDVSAMSEQTREAEATNVKVRANQHRARLFSTFSEVRGEALQLGARMDALREEKAGLLRAANLPIVDLAIMESDGGYALAYRGTALADCASSEKLRVSLALAMALHPKVRVALIREASLLDDESMRVLRELAEQHKFQVWCERVSTTKESADAFLIEEGQLAEK